MSKNSSHSSIYRRSRTHIAAVLSCLLIGLSTPAILVHADEPLRLLIVKTTIDAETQRGQCVRGQLFLVRSFDAADLDRGTWIADTLEVPAKAHLGVGLMLPKGGYSAAVRGEAPEGWGIELSSGSVLRAHPGARKTDEAAIYLGRRSKRLPGPCELVEERLQDGEAITRRLRRILNWGQSEQAIEGQSEQTIEIMVQHQLTE